MAAGAVVGALVAEPLLRIVLGPAFATEASSFRVLLLGTVPGCLAMMLFPSLTAQGRAGLAALIFAPAVALHAVLCWTLAPTLGLEGAALAYVVCQLLVAGSLVIAFHRLYGIGWSEALLVQREDVRRAVEVIRRRLGRAAQPR
jgi:O-antigen/teichoic acid export membrane protein